MVIVDAHLHVWSDDEDRYPFAGDRQPPSPGSVGLLRQEMAAAGVARAVIVQPIYHLYDHRYVLAALQRFPDQFAGVALLDPHAADAPERLQRRVEEDGFAGMRLYLSRQERPQVLAAPQQDPLWRRARSLGAVIIIFGQARDLPAIEPIIARFPQVKVVIDHLGGVPPAEAAPRPLLANLLRLARYPNVYVKFSNLNRLSRQPYPHDDMVPVVRRVYDRFGAERLMWGSDFPHVLRDCGYGPALAMARQQLAWLSDGERRQMFGLTAQDLWF